MGLVEYLARSRVDTSCWVVDLGQLRANLELLERVRSRTGAKILLALKNFAT